MARSWLGVVLVVLLLITTFLLFPKVVVGQTWRGLTVAPEFRCSAYEPSDYSYPQSVELRIIESLGGVWSPYTGQTFSNRRQTDIEHIVARSEAHDSGLCSADRTTRRRFARDPLNLTLASPRVNRRQKRAFDAAEWMPAINRCWFSDRIVRVRQKYNLTIDRREVDALDAVMASCTSFALARDDGLATGGAPPTVPVALPEDVARWDDNQDGRITCAEARVHGITPVGLGHPAYPYMRDGDGDGVVCESGRTIGRPRANGGSRKNPLRGIGALDRYDDNSNGRISCAEARRHGIAPVRRGHPAYRHMNDRDNDGTVCE